MLKFNKLILTQDVVEDRLCQLITTPFCILGDCIYFLSLGFIVFDSMEIVHRVQIYKLDRQIKRRNKKLSQKSAADSKEKEELFI